MKSASSQNFIASVTDDCLDQIEKVADNLRSHGCQIRQILKLSGVITGKVGKNVDLEHLRIEGIASIEKQRILKKK